MKTRLKILAAITVLALLFCLGGCAGTGGSASSEDSGISSSSDGAPDESGSESGEDAENSGEASSSSAPEESSDAPEGGSYGDFTENVRFVYNGVEFGVGEEGAPVVEKLGNQLKPSEKLQPCIPGAGELDSYFYKGFSFQVTQFGLISGIYLNEEFSKDDGCKSLSGVGLGMTEDEVKAILGDPPEDYDGYYIYKSGSASLSVMFDQSTGLSMSVSAEDMDLPL